MAERKPPARARRRKTTQTAVRHHIDALRRGQPVDTYGEALATLALDLAEHIDRGVPVHMTGTWHRELRQTLEALGPSLVVPGPEDADGDDDAEPEDPDAWLDGLSTPVRDAEEG